MMSGFWKKWALRAALTLLAIVVYVATAIPLGLFFYTLKSEWGWDVFKVTGFHGYLQCLIRESEIGVIGVDPLPGLSK